MRATIVFDTTRIGMILGADAKTSFRLDQWPSIVGHVSSVVDLHVSARAPKVDFITRIGWRAVKLFNAANQPFDLIAVVLIETSRSDDLASPPEPRAGQTARHASCKRRWKSNQRRLQLALLARPGRRPGLAAGRSARRRLVEPYPETNLTGTPGWNRLLLALMGLCPFVGAEAKPNTSTMLHIW